MSFSGENGDGPAVLQLQKWSLLQFQLELSDFCEASISPTRELLLLLSHQCEALLLPLYFGKELSSALTDNDDPSRIHPDDLQGPSSFIVSSPDQTTRCRPVLSASALCPIDPAAKDRSLVSKYHPIISNVKSFTWGHHGDAYNQFKDSGYREFLIVAGADDIVVHAFRYLEHSSILDSEAGGTHVHGKWVEWGPTQSRKAEEHLTHSSKVEFVDVNNTSRAEGKQHSPRFKDFDSSNSNSTQRKWFKTFLTILDTSVTDGKCSARFPTKSSLPHSVEVVSFSISDSISMFLDFLFSSSPKSCKMDQSVETVPGQVGNIPIDDSPHGIPGYFSCKSADRRLLYQCSKVFSSSSQQFVGLVLAFSEKASINKEEDLQSVPSKIQVVICMLHHWGIQWTTAINLQDQFSSSGLWPEWADFQFSGNFLVCLNTSGLICIWGAETGNFIKQFDVLQSFGMDRKFSSNQQTPFVNIDTSPELANFDEETDQRSRANGVGTSSACLVRARAFRKIMVASHSFLLAVIDDNGVIYVIFADEYITENQYLFEKFVPPSDLGIMANWKIAGDGTVGRQVFPHLTHGQGLPVQNIWNGVSSKMEHTRDGSDRRKQFAKYKENQLSAYSSGFTALSQKHCRKMSPSGSEISSAPIRRIFLPLDRFEIDDSICFSSFGITRVVKCPNLNEQKRYKIVHTGLHVAPSVLSETDADIYCLSKSHSRKECTFVGESIGCSFQGCLYLVTQDGLSVILPSVSVSTGLLPEESTRFLKLSAVRGMGINELKFPHRPWQIEVLDRILLYEGPEEAEHVSLKNGWDLSFARLRRLQLALHYLNSEEIEKSLDTLVDVNLAEEGILRLLFTSVYQYSCKVGGDNEVALASRLLSLASCFAIKMVRRYGLVEHKKDKFMASAKKDIRVSYLLPVSPKPRLEDFNSRRLQEMAHFLEVIRNLQNRLATRNKRPGQMADGLAETSLTDIEMLGGDSFPFVTANTVSSGVSDAVEAQCKGELALTVPDVEFNSTDSLTLTSTCSSVDVVNLHGINAQEEGPLQGRSLIFSENARDMIARWAVDNLDFKSVVKDALQSGRLPLAVLQLHLQRQQELSEKGYHDMFSEVREIGRAICYDLFLKGESALAMTTLQRLGEDIETILRQLLFGTVSRSLRAHVLVEMLKYGWLRPHEWKIFERISVFERLYPSSSFWKTFLARQNNISGAGALPNSPEETNLKVKFLVCDNLTVECDDIDGVVIGGWENVSNGSAFAKECDDNAQTGYWACAAAWSDAWDQRTMDRIVLDQPFHMGVDVAWESQLEYHMCHNDVEEIYRLLDVIPKYLLMEGTLKVNLFSSHSFENIGTITGFPDYTRYCSAEALEPVFMDIPSVEILRSSAVNSCSSWLKVLVEKELAKKYIFIKEYWDSTAEIMPLLAHAGLIFDTSRVSLKTEPFKRSLDLDIFHSEQSHKDTEAALHILVLRHCINHNLPNLLDLYLDHHNMVLDDSSLSSLVEAAGDCQWAKWLLYTRIKSREYYASFSNARSNLSRQMISGSNLDILEIDEIISTVDDIAEGGGEMAALATLMYASIPMQKCLCSGSVNKHCDSSSQCMLENLRPGLQKFPTLWRTLVAACFSQDADGHSLSSSTGFARLSFSDYASWRYHVFSSSEGDTSLIQMLPFWFPKSIRRLIKLSVQGPLGWQSLSGEEYSGGSFLYKDMTHAFKANGDADTRAIEWEQTIQRSVEKMYSSLKGNGFGVEHHLHRGRALAAFNHVLDLRALKLKSTEKDQLLSGQYNIQSDVQMMLSPLTQSEGSLLSSVMPLAIMHFEDSALVASCAFLLELCGLSASMLRIDIAALRRISSYYKLNEHNAAYEHVSPRTTFYSVPYESDFTSSLARALADDYMKLDHLQNLEIKASPNKVSTSKQPSRSLITVLQHLENASLPLMDGSGTCGLWLSSGNGDGFEFRNQQKDSSQNWSLVTGFCQMHHLPLSTRYLALLANDNDWVGFLTEAQCVGFSIDVVIQVATQEFRDPRLRTHILTVLKNMQSTRRKTISSPKTSSAGRSFEVPFATDNNIVVPMELFGILAECERQKNPGESLLVKAKDLRWSLLAVIASCFSDVSPLSCLSVWLEITAARETSSIKVNDITSRIVNGVGAAVEATNIRLPGSRTPTFHYNRRNPKRRRIVEPSVGFFVADASSFPNSPSSVIASLAQEMSSEEEKRKLTFEQSNVSSDSDGGLVSLSNMVSVLCEQHLFLPLLRAFEMFMPACSLLPFIRSLQAFSQMRLSEASAHLASFSARIREEPFLIQVNMGKDEKLKTAWTSSTAVKAAEAMLSTCPSAYEKRCLLQLLSAADFGDGGFATTYFRRLHWKINLAEPSLRKDVDAYLGNETLDDASLLSALEKNGQWEQARNWARQLESSGASWKSAVHHVTETQAESMVLEWKEFLWDIPEERAALWNHCQTLFLRYSFPALQAGLFFLKHAEAVEKEIPPKELHEMLLFSLQWLSGMMTQSNPVYPLDLLREIETRVWLLAVESEAQSKTEGCFTSPNFFQNLVDGNSNSIIEQTANIITKMDNHLSLMRMRATERNETRESNLSHHRHLQVSEFNNPGSVGSNVRTKRRAKIFTPLRRPIVENLDGHNDSDDYPSSPHNKNIGELSKNQQLHEDNLKIEASLLGWEERVTPADLERAVLSLLEFGQMTAAKQLQEKLSPEHVPSELVIVDAALKIAALSSSSSSGEINDSMLDSEVRSFILSLGILISNDMIDPLQVLESLADKCGEGCGHGLCRRIIAVTKAARVLGLPFTEAFEKRPLELLQLLSLKAQDSLEEAKLIVQTHVIPPSSIARVLAESFLKGLLAAHRGGYMDSQKEEGPAPLLWRFSDFLKWAELCPSEPEIGHALMRLVMTGQDIPHACEVELLILSHHFYKSSACLDGVDVLVTLAANRVESYVLEGDFSCLARLIIGVSNFHALNFILNILIENGQLEVLLQKYNAAEAVEAIPDAGRGFRLAVLTSLKLFNPNDLDAFAMVYNHFDLKHETAALLESRAMVHLQQWWSRWDKDRQNEDLLESMRHLIEAAEVLSSTDAGHKTHRACARACLVSLQIRIPDLNWLELSETNARRAFVEQSRFQEALIVAEAYNLNQPSEWAPVLWNLMLKPDLIEQFVAEFVAVLPLQSSMLLELAKFYRAEVAARGDQSHFSVWLSPGGLPAEWVKHLGRSFRSLLKRTRDLRVRMQLATIATGFGDVINACLKDLDKVPDNAGPLILRRGHGGAYLPLM